MQPRTETDRLAGVLRAHYGLHAEQIMRLPIGQGTINYRVVTAERTVFVKHYPPDTDLDAERAGIAMSCLAGRAGVPVASPRASVQGDVLINPDGFAVSVWDFVPGSTIAGRFTRAQLAATGAALGRLHRTFADQPARSEVSETGEWLAFDPGPTLTTVETLLGTVVQRRRGGQGDEFDAVAERTLIQRRDQLPRVTEQHQQVLVSWTGTRLGDAARDLVAALSRHTASYTLSEIHAIIDSMPLVAHYAQPDPVFEQWTVIFRDHYLEHSVGFVLGLHRAGVPAQWMMTWAKGDRTHNRDRDRVHATFTDYGFTSGVLGNSAIDGPLAGDQPDPATAQASARVEEFIDRAHAAGRRVLVIDDGGLLARGYGAPHSPHRVDAALELTVSGLKRIHAAGKPGIPVINMARSAVKVAAAVGPFTARTTHGEVPTNR